MASDLDPSRPAPVPGVVDILAPARRAAPLVFSSPHSGRDYPAAFVRQARLDPLGLRRSEDAFVDDIFAAVPEHGAPLVRALFPRAFVDPNREPFELDPRMFTGALPTYANTASPRVAAGLGTIARVVTNGEEFYAGRLTVDEGLDRIARYYEPYHAALRREIAAAREAFGHCVLIDCHSMPSVGGPMDFDAGRRRVDFILGDAHGRACSPRLTEQVEVALRGQGYNVTRNAPYSGGYITRHYGRPDTGVEALQIEINRALYMDEERVVPKPYLATLAAHMGSLVAALCHRAPDVLAAE